MELNFIKIAISEEKNLDTSSRLQFFTHLLSVINRILQFGNVLVVRNADNEGADFLPCVMSHTRYMGNYFMHKAHPLSFTRTSATKGSSS